jgi:hypothetical protein
MRADIYIKKFVFFSIAINCLFLSACDNRADVKKVEAVVTPTVLQHVETVNAYTPEHVANLTKIVIAIEKYKQDHKSYPISSRQKTAWDKLFTKNGNVDSEWLAVLVPDYIDAMPISASQNQYIYMSNGAQYKLLVLEPSDCEFVKSKTPDLIDPRRHCSAYGFWTARAVKW